VAGTANLFNLLDLRPGRALKVSLVAAPAVLAPHPAAGLAAAVVGTGAALLPADLAERSMLGDCGANAVGAVLGTAMVAATPRPVRLVLLAAVTGLTLASEKVSFTKVIEATPVLRELDAIGRRPR
jgi:UDP-N-acetylmuramyl pentapeptide phosphotransferase/UDP-N-acetylglucosamine-1-phosphate transferase